MRLLGELQEGITELEDLITSTRSAIRENGLRLAIGINVNDANSLTAISQEFSDSLKLVVPNSRLCGHKVNAVLEVLSPKLAFYSDEERFRIYGALTSLRQQLEAWTQEIAGIQGIEGVLREFNLSNQNTTQVIDEVQSSWEDQWIPIRIGIESMLSTLGSFADFPLKAPHSPSHKPPAAIDVVINNRM